MNSKLCTRIDAHRLLECMEEAIARRRFFCFKLNSKNDTELLCDISRIIPHGVSLAIRDDIITEYNDRSDFEYWLNSIGTFGHSHIYFYNGSEFGICDDDDPTFDDWEYFLVTSSDEMNETNGEKKCVEDNNMKMNMKSMMSKYMPEELGNEVAFTFDGHIAVRAEDGNYYYYNGQQLVNVYDMVMPVDDMAMLVPTLTLAVGDVIKFNHSFYYITACNQVDIIGINLSSGSVDSMIITTDVLGISAYQKVMSVMSMMGGSSGMMGGFTNNMNPFNMMVMMSFMNDEDEKDSKSGFKKMMQMQFMMQMFNNGAMGMNPFAPFNQVKPNCGMQSPSMNNTASGETDAEEDGYDSED